MTKNIEYIGYAKGFEKQLKKAPKYIQQAFHDRFALFLEDPTHPFLHTHLLTGTYTGKKSINITGDWRVIIIETQGVLGGRRIKVFAIGTHSQLYR